MYLFPESIFSFNMDPFIGAIVFSLLAIVVYYRGATRKLTLPPGPPGELISGSIKQLIHRRPWLVYAKWAETYGEEPNRTCITCWTHWVYQVLLFLIVPTTSEWWC